MQEPRDTFGKWMGVLFVSGIPVIGFIMLLVWAFGNSAPGIKNYARAALVWQIIAIVAIIVIVVVFAVTGITLQNIAQY